MSAAPEPPGRVLTPESGASLAPKVTDLVPLTGDEDLDWSDVPSQLGEMATLEWKRLGRAFEHAPGRFREGDRAALIAYCSWLSIFLTAMAEVNANGVLVQGRSSADKARGDGAGMVKNPAEALARNASQQLRYWSRELGLTPAARAAMKIIGPAETSEEDTENPY